MKELTGRITIGRIMSTDPDELPIWISITDDKSGVLACRAKITLEQYANVITGRGDIDCVLEFNDSGLVGKVRIHKTVIVPHSEKLIYEEGEVTKYLSDKCSDIIKDGWKPYVNDFTNSHRYTQAGIEVNFTKYVDADSDEAKAKGRSDER